MSAIATSAIGSASRHGNKSRAPKSQPKEADTAAPAEDIIMARRCELSGKGVQVGHRVSHSNIKTKHRFLPNLQRSVSGLQNLVSLFL